MTGIRIFFVALGVLFFNLVVFGQKPSPSSPERSVEERPETREVSRPVETRAPEPPPAREEPKPDTSSNNNNNSSRNNDNSNNRSSDSSSSSSSSDSGSSRNKNRDNDERRRGDAKNSDRKDDDRNKGDKDKDHRGKGDGDRRGRKDDDNDKDGKGRRGKRDDDDDRRRHRRDRDIYIPPTDDISSSTNSSKAPFKSPFGKNDVSYNVYTSYIDPVSGNFQPYFDLPLTPDFRPLIYVYRRDFNISELPFIGTDWVIYYEPDMGDIFINLARLAPVKYERMVWLPLGDVKKRLAKSLKIDATVMRPTIVEKIEPSQSSKDLFAFGVSMLPKGDYEMRLIAADGTTLKQQITIK